MSDPFRALQRITLTPTHIMDLRASLHARGSSDGTNGIVGVPFMIYSPSEDAFVLHHDGAVWAQHADPRVLAQMMACERAERGFIRRVLSALEPCDVATLSPDARARHATQQRALSHKLTADIQADFDARDRRSAALNLTRLNLTDLL